MNLNSVTSNRSTGGLWRWLPGFKTILVVVSLLGLTAANVASVVNASAHDWMHNSLWRILSVGGDAMASRALADSPRARVVAIETKHADLDRKYRAQTLALEQSNARANRLTQQLEVSGKRAKATVDAVHTRLRKGIARNIGSLPLEAIPVAGIATALTMTAWDIHDACETMKDFNALLLEMGQGETEPDVCGQKVPTRKQVVEMTCEKVRIPIFCRGN